MSDVGVDDLIEELFPAKTQKNSLPLSSAVRPTVGRRQSEWDDSDGDSAAEALTGARAPAHHPPTRYAPPGQNFDDSSSSSSSSTSRSGDQDGKGNAAGGYSEVSAPTRRVSDDSQHGAPSLRRGMSCPVIHPVPFPSLADSEGAFSCAPRCYVTNHGAAVRGADGHPSLQQLRELAANERVILGCTRVQAMLKKGALHALPSKLGNGCLDHHGDYANDGGCPHILCRTCNYMVVRLQGAEWDDERGHVNLYLTLRNYYPDWCRLASATPVGVEDGQGASRHVLKGNSMAAAYCCQCSWLTVKTAKAVIETKLTDAFLAQSGANGDHRFATELPLVPGEKRRPPLWVCHGHPQ